MSTIHAQIIGDQALLPRTELERLLELARRTEAVDLQFLPEDTPDFNTMAFADQGGAFDFWREEGESVYSAQDGEAIQW